MGIVKGGILGTVIQKVANVVFQKWKSHNTVREKVDPANPQTPKQVFQRDRFSFITILGRLINISVVRPFWAYLATGFTTAWNEFFSFNIPLQPVYIDEVTPFVPDFSEVVATSGLLEPAPIVGNIEYDPLTGLLTWGWSDVVIGNGLPTDITRIVVVDEENGVALISPEVSTTRTDGSDNMNIAVGRVAVNLHAYFFLHRGAGAEIEVSTSEYSIVTAV